MTNDLIERYIYAATKRLPDKIKDDVSEELRALIDDMLSERCENVTPQDKDIKIVLTELGTPNELYEKYNPDTKNCLIGSPYFSNYKYVLKIILICVGIGITISTVISKVMTIPENYQTYSYTLTLSSPDFWIDLFKDLLISLPSALIWVFAFITLLFAFFYHKDIKIDSSENLDNLPPNPQKKAENLKN